MFWLKRFALFHGLNVMNTVLPLLFFILFFMFNGIFGYYSAKSMQESQLQVNQSLANINLINELHLEVIKAETGQRGYLLTDLPEYVEPYYEAVAVIDQKLQDFSNAVFTADQEALADNLQLLVMDKMKELEATISALEENRETDAVRLLFTHRGRNVMQEISDLSEMIELQERRLLAARTAQAEESRVRAFYLILTANLVGLIMVIISFNLIRIGRENDREYARKLEESNDTLEDRVEERTIALEHFSNELKRSNRELQDFAFVASHDLQEPLRKIRSFGDRLQSNYADILGEQGINYINRMRNASERMSKLISDLLAFSRITSKAKPFLPVNLEAVLDAVLEDLEVLIEESGGTVEYDPLPTIEADELQMKQLFQNLIGNGLKFKKKDIDSIITVNAEIILGTDDSEGLWDKLKLQFKDNGIGLDERFSERIFMPFQRLHGKGDYEGTGIGLSICRRIVERHNGSISVSSEVGKGSVFTVVLPLVKQQFDIEEQV